MSVLIHRGTLYDIIVVSFGGGIAIHDSAVCPYLLLRGYLFVHIVFCVVTSTIYKDLGTPQFKTNEGKNHLNISRP